MDEHCLVFVEHLIQLLRGLKKLLGIHILLAVVEGQVDHVGHSVLGVDRFHVLKRDLPLLHILLGLEVEHALDSLLDNEVDFVGIRRIRPSVNPLLPINLIYEKLTDQIAVDLVSKPVYGKDLVRVSLLSRAVITQLATVLSRILYVQNPPRVPLRLLTLYRNFLITIVDGVRIFPLTEFVTINIGQLDRTLPWHNILAKLRFHPPGLASRYPGHLFHLVALRHF